MLFWLFVILTVVGIGLAILFDKIYCEVGLFASGTIAFLSGLAAIASIFIIIYNHAGIEGKIASFDEYRKMVETKIESGVYADEFGILDKNVVDEIKNYNTQLRYKQAYSHDFWIGIYYPSVYDDLELIEYNIVPTRERG